MLSGKVVVVSGADTALGLIIATRFAYEGGHVILLGLDLEKLTALDDSIKKLGHQATLVQLDTLDSTKVEELSHSLGNVFSKIDILVTANLYYGKPNVVVDYSVDEWTRIMGVNLSSNWMLLKYLTPLLKISKCARVVFPVIESFYANKNEFFTPYTVSRCALVKFVEEYMREDSNNAIRVNVIAMENYSEGIINSEEQANEISDFFLKFSADGCLMSGKKHHIYLSDTK